MFLHLNLAPLQGAPLENYLERMEQNFLDHNERYPSMKMASNLEEKKKILATKSSKKSRNSATLFCKQASKQSQQADLGNILQRDIKPFGSA